MIAIEMFPCSGGMAEGFRRAGITFAHAFDKDPDACASYEANHGHRPIQIDVRDLVRMVGGGWRMGEIDLLVADPPCTPWSRAGKRLGTADERDMLEETAELIRLLRPRAYLIGNVPGLDDSTQWHVVQRVIGGLAKDGYCVRDYASLDAADFGVPQHRIRPFWFGHLAGPCIRWPAPTHGDPSKSLALPGMGLKPWVTCRAALQHLPLAELGRPVRMRVRPPGEFVLEWPWDRPATTVCSRDTIPPPGHHPESGSILSMPNAVVLSEKAAAILQGFPSGWVFSGKTKKARWSQLGQAMPPGLAEAVARGVVEQMAAARARAA